MPRVRKRVVGLLALSTIAAPWPAASQGDRLRPYICSAKYGQPPTSPVSFLYRSGVFQSGADPQTIADGWEAYLRQTFASQGGITEPACQPVSQDPAAQSLAVEMIDRQASEAGRSVVPVRWQHTEEQAVDAGGAPVRTPAGWYCSTDPAQSPIYFSDVFEGDETLAATRVAAAFFAFLRQRHSYANAAPNAVTCAPSRSIADGQVSKAQWQSVWREARRQIVETGWRLRDATR